MQPEFENGSEITSGRLQKILPKAVVMEAFNSILADQLAAGGVRLSGAGRHALPIGSDSMDAAEVAAGLVVDVGLDPVYGGTLSESWRVERARPGFCRPLDADSVRETLEKTERGDFVPEGSWRN